MQPFLTAHQAQIAELCHTQHVRRMAVFGFAVRNDFDPARSDLDLLAEFCAVPVDRYFDNKASLRDALTANVRASGGPDHSEEHPQLIPAARDRLNRRAPLCRVASISSFPTFLQASTDIEEFTAGMDFGGYEASRLVRRSNR